MLALERERASVFFSYDRRRERRVKVEGEALEGE